MIRTTIHAIITLMFLVCCRGLPVDAAAQTKDKDEPAKKSDPTFPDGLVHDFGKVGRGSEPKHAFRIANSSGAVMRLIEVRVSMSPVQAWLTKGELRKNEVGYLEVAINWSVL